MSKQSIADNMAFLRSKKKNKPAARQTSLSYGMRKALKGRASLADNPIAIKQIKSELLRKGNIAKNTTVSAKKSLSAIAEHVAGRSQAEVEAKYDLGNGFVNKALKRMFPNAERMEETLENLLLSNAIVSSMVFDEKAPDMTARDAAVSAGIFTQRYTDLHKARRSNFQPETPVAIIVQLESTMERIKQVHGRTLELDEE